MDRNHPIGHGGGKRDREKGERGEARERGERDRRDVFSFLISFS
jgi:hypothetical protein